MNMAKSIVIISFCLMGISFGMPASNEQLDKHLQKTGPINQTDVNSENAFKNNLSKYLVRTYDQSPSSATVNDVAVNAVSEERKPDLVQQQAPSTVEITGITTGANPAPANPVAPQDNGGFRPQRAGSMFARLIDDIFQIPITVLQNVAKLITNPFTQARKEAAAAAATS